MPSELLVRPGLDDHIVIADVLGSVAPSSGSAQLPVARLVSDAHHAAARQEYSEIAGEAGIPYLVDPLTYLWHGPVREDHAWASLPFGQASTVQPQALDDPFERERLVVGAVDFQRERGASAIIPPYPYVEGPTDPWLDVALDLLDRTAKYVADSGLHLPLVPVFCFKVQAFATTEGLELGIDRFGEVARRHDVAFIGACPSPAGGKDDGVAKARWVFRTLLRLNSFDLRVVGWRLGALGPALVAAGLAGYETGLGIGEGMNVSSKRANLKPRDRSESSGGGNDFVYLQPFNRSVRKRVASILLEDAIVGAEVMCDDTSCCPTRAETLGANRRAHVIKSRARQLRELDRQPHREWRLYQIASEAEHAATVATQANRILSERAAQDGASLPRLGVKGHRAIAEVVRELSQFE